MPPTTDTTLCDSNFDHLSAMAPGTETLGTSGHQIEGIDSDVKALKVVKSAATCICLYSSGSVSFFSFNAFPKELQLQIWNIAISELEEQYVSLSKARNADAVLALMHACHDSRTETMKSYPQVQTTPSCSLFFYNYEKDVLCINFKPASPTPPLRHNTAEIPSRILATIYGSAINLSPASSFLISPGYERLH